MRACLSGSTLEVAGPRSGAPTVVWDVVSGDGSQAGAVYGRVTPAEAESIVHALARGGDPGGPDVPWLALARTRSGGLAAAASMMLSSGVFWSRTGGTLVVASDPRSAAGPSPALATDYVRAFAAGEVLPGTSPYAGVHRVPAGRTLTWESVDASPTESVWCGPWVWPEPALTGADAMAAYRDAFDTATRELARRAGPLVVAVSGGLDSTFLAATLSTMHAGAGPVCGLVYAPLPEAELSMRGSLLADEGPAARLLAADSGGRLVVDTVVNTDHVRPLAAAAEAARLAGVPTFNPANQWWLTRIRERAAREGTGLWFVGSNGNAAFSFTHAYAADYYLRRRQWADLARLARGTGAVDLHLLRSRVLGPLRHRHLHSGGAAQAAEHPLARFGVGATGALVADDRAGYLRWLARSATGLPAASNPAALEGVLVADPFASRAVIEVAAAITPAEWVRGPLPRGFARRAAEGRVPDEIRLRRGRGQQGRDAWFVIRHDRDDYLDRIAAVTTIPGLEEIATRELAHAVARWPWGEVQGPSWLEQVAVDRLLSVAQFASVWSS